MVDTRDSEEFRALIDEAGRFELADVKALEAEWDHAAQFLPEGQRGEEVRAQMIAMLQAAVEIARLEKQAMKGVDHG